MKTAKASKAQQDREELFLLLIRYLELLNNAELSNLADDAGVSRSTLRNWLAYRTLTPKLATFCRVLRALGFTVKLVQAPGVKPRRIK